MILVVLAGVALTLLALGSLMLQIARARALADPIAHAAVAMAVGVSVIALLFQFGAPMRWSPATARLFAGLVLLAWIAWTPWRRLSRMIRRWPARWCVVVVAFLILIVTLAVMQSRGVRVAPGVDSVHHLMLTRLIVDAGRLPDDLEPFISSGRLAYHWGAHANVAFAALLAGRTGAFEVSELMVGYAALLRIIATLAMYAAGRSIFRSRYAGLIAGALAAGFSPLPAALVAQGRFTHLAGVAVLVGLLALVPADRQPLRRSIVLAVLLAGVFLLQARLLVFAVAWLVVTPLISPTRRPLLSIMRIAVPLAVSALLVLPWATRLVGDPLVHSMVRGSGYAQSENRWTQRVVPRELLWLGNNALLLSGATAGISGVAGLGVSRGQRIVSLFWFAIVLFAVYRVTSEANSKRQPKRRRTRQIEPAIGTLRPFPWRPVAAMAGWVVLSSAFLFARSATFDLTSVVPYAAGILTAFIPTILLTSAIASWVSAVLTRSSATIAMLILVVTCITGITRRSDYVVTTPVPEADYRAMKWITEGVPSSARFAVMAKPFYGVFVGQDAGYWLQVLTDRSSLLPPLIYGWVSPVPQVERTNKLLRTWMTVHPDASVPRMIEAGVTHAYIGSTTDAQAREIMRGSARFHVIYDRDNVLIAQLVNL